MMKGNNKYCAKKVKTPEGVFDSHHEYQRWLYLKALENEGRIRDLRRQVTYELIPAQYEYYPRYGKTGKRITDGKTCLERHCYYIADFVYYDCDKRKEVVEDAKGFRTDDYIIKRKLMLWVHGVSIYET